MERPPYLWRNTIDMLHPKPHRRNLSLSVLEQDIDEKHGEVNVERSPITRAATPQAVKAFATSAWSVRPTPRSMTALLRHVFIGLLPSFILPKTHGDTQEKLLPTAHLDGMRGLAAFCVFICHMSYAVFVVTYGFGQGEPGANPYLFQLPIIRLFYSGPPMVAIFFIISGYALSYKPLKQMRSRQFEGLLHTLSSSVFRRGLRLYVPCFVSTFLVLIAVRIGLYEMTQSLYDDPNFIRNARESHRVRLDTLTEQLWDWAYKMFDFVHPWDWNVYGGSVDYDRHLWTIPTEFRASMVLFLTHFAVARLRTPIRLVMLGGLIWWALHWDRWEVILFWSGCILAEIDLIKLSRRQSHLHAKAPSLSPSTQTPFWHYFWILNFFVGCYLASYPDDAGDSTPGFRTLTLYIPAYYTEQRRFWQSIGATHIVLSTNNSAWLQSWFTTPLAQYLGKISYSLYLMHGPIIHTFGYLAMAWWWGWTGMEDGWRYESGFFAAGCCIVGAVVWAADVFWRAVDAPSVRFARWVEGRCVVSM